MMPSPELPADKLSFEFFKAHRTDNFRTAQANALLFLDRLATLLFCPRYGASGVTLLERLDAGPVPISLAAFTVNV